VEEGKLMTILLGVLVDVVQGPKEEDLIVADMDPDRIMATETTRMYERHFYTSVRIHSV
jgi:hypothetical protein